jgi:hypothetical protein
MGSFNLLVLQFEFKKHFAFEPAIAENNQCIFLVRKA